MSGMYGPRKQAMVHPTSSTQLPWAYRTRFSSDMKRNRQRLTCLTARARRLSEMTEDTIPSRRTVPIQCCRKQLGHTTWDARCLTASRDIDVSAAYRPRGTMTNLAIPLQTSGSRLTRWGAIRTAVVSSDTQQTNIWVPVSLFDEQVGPYREP